MDDLYIKIILLGDSYVGKTSLLLKYTDDYFSEVAIATIGAEYKEKMITLNNRNIRLQIWDTSGQERYRSIAQNFYRGSDGILLVFDVTNKESFENIKFWLNDPQVDAKKILIGNKIDLEEHRVISKEKMEKLGEKYNLNSFETSAKTGENVDTIFTEITKLIIENKSDEVLDLLYSKDKQNLSISSEPEEKKKKIVVVNKIFIIFI